MLQKKLDYYRGQHCMKIFCEFLKEHVERIIYCEEKEAIPLTDEENESYLKQEVCHICKNKIYY